MDDDPDFNLGYDAMIADTYDSGYPIWFDYIQKTDNKYDEEDWYTMDYYLEIYYDTMINFWDYPIDCIDEVEEEESLPEEDPDFNLGYDITDLYEIEQNREEDDPDFNLGYEVILALGEVNYDSNKIHYMKTTPIGPNKLTHKGCSTLLLDSVSNTKRLKSLLGNPNVNVNKKISFRSQAEISLGGPSQYPLLKAIQCGNIDSIKALLEAPGINLHISNEYGETPLCAALESKRDNYPREEIVNLLLNTKGISKNFTYLVEDVAFCRRPPPTIAVTVKTKTYVDGKEVHYILGGELVQAITSQNVPEIERLLEEPMLDINHISLYNDDGNGTFPLAHAIMLGREDIVQMLLSHPRIDVNNKLACEIDWNYFHDTQFIIPTGKTALMYATQMGNEAIVALLLSMPGIDVNCQTTKNKYSALMYACYGVHINIIERLLQMPDIDLYLENWHKVTVFKLGPSIQNVSAFEYTNIFEKICRMLLAHPTAKKRGACDVLGAIFCSNGIAEYMDSEMDHMDSEMDHKMDRKFIEFILQCETENPIQLRTERYKALLFAIKDSKQHVNTLMNGHINVHRLLRMAIEHDNTEAILFLIQTMSVTKLKRTLQWKHLRRYTNAAIIIRNRIQMLEELRAITEIDLFASHLRPLPLDVQRIIGHMVHA